jgi:hypothetical protein
MVRRSELPTVPPQFDVGRYARDSEDKVATAAPAAPEEGRAAESETRLVTRRPVGEAATDEAWARALVGSLLTATPLDQLKGMPLDHRAAYLLSWMDGSIDLDTLVEISTMSREEVLRIVRDLYESGIVQMR